MRVRVSKTFGAFFFVSWFLACATQSTDDAGASANILSTWAGDGTQGFDGDGFALAESWLNQPMDMTFGPDGLACIADWNNHRIRRVNPEGLLITQIGTSLPGDWPCQEPTDATNCEVALTGSVSGTELSLNHPTDIVFDENGIAFIAAWHNHKIERMDPQTGEVTIIAGQQLPGFAGDNGPAINAKLNFPDSLAFDAVGNLFVADERNNRIRRIAKDATSTITTVVGSSLPPSKSEYAGDGGPATSAKLALTAYDELGGSDNPPPGGPIAFDEAGNLYISDTANHCIRVVTPGADGIVGDGDAAAEIITTVVGQCTVSGHSGDNGPATEATLNSPHDIEFGPDGRLFIADTGNNVVRAVDLDTAIISAIAGTGEEGFSGNADDPLQATFREPYGLAFDSDGKLYIVDTLNNRIRMLVN